MSTKPSKEALAAASCIYDAGDVAANAAIIQLALDKAHDDALVEASRVPLLCEGSDNFQVAEQILALRRKET